MRSKLFIYVISVLMCSACSKSSSEQQQDVGTSSVPLNSKKENQLKEFRNANYALTYLTPEYRASQLYETGSSQYRAELINQQEQSVYRLRISNNLGKPVLDYDHPDLYNREDRLQYFMNSFPLGITMLSETDTLKPSFYHLVQPNPMVPYIDLMVGFDQKYNPNDLFQFEDEYFNNGRIKLRT